MPHDWQINDESCYDAKFEYHNPAADGAEAVLTLTGFKEGWKQAMGDLLDGMADSWRWNVKCAIPDEGFDIVDGYIEVPYRVSPTCVAKKGTVLKAQGRTYTVPEEVEVVLPTEIILAHVDQKSMLICRAIHEGTGLRADGKRINSGGVCLPMGVLIACGFDPDAADEPDATSIFTSLSNPFGSRDPDAQWT